MSTAGANILRDCELPIFFNVAETGRSKLPLPRNPPGQAIRVWSRSLSVMQKEAIVLSALTGRAWRLASDEGPYLDGCDEAPCPLSFLSTGMISSDLNEICALASQRGIGLHRIVLVQDNFYTMEGSALRAAFCTPSAGPISIPTCGSRAA